MHINLKRKRQPWSRPSKLTLAFFTLFLALIAMFGLWRVQFEGTNSLDFYWHRSTYDAIVRQAKQLGVAPGKYRTVTFPALLLPKNRYLGDTSSDVNIERDLAGHYTITIVINDWGHAGVYGYVYSDIPPKAITDDTYFNAVLPPPFASLDLRINSHWWTASNNLG